MKRLWPALLLALMLLSTLGSSSGGCGDDDPAPTCEAACTSSGKCSLAMPYVCSTTGACYETEDKCINACCPSARLRP